MVLKLITVKITEIAISGNTARSGKDELAHTLHNSGLSCQTRKRKVQANSDPGAAHPEPLEAREPGRGLSRSDQSASSHRPALATE